MWTTNTRADISCSVALLTQVTQENFEHQRQVCIEMINAVISHLEKNPNLDLHFLALERTTLRLQVYSDASFATNYDNTSQSGYFVFFIACSCNFQPLYWTFYTSKRSTRLLLGTEVMAFVDAFDMAYTIKHDLKSITKLNTPLSIMADNRSLFDVLTRARCTTEKCLTIYFQPLKMHTETLKLTTSAL